MSIEAVIELAPQNDNEEQPVRSELLSRVFELHDYVPTGAQLKFDLVFLSIARASVKEEIDFKYRIDFIFFLVAVISLSQCYKLYA